VGRLTKAKHGGRRWLVHGDFATGQTWLLGTWPRAMSVWQARVVVGTSFFSVPSSGCLMIDPTNVVIPLWKILTSTRPENVHCSQKQVCMHIVNPGVSRTLPSLKVNSLKYSASAAKRCQVSLWSPVSFPMPLI